MPRPLAALAPVLLAACATLPSSSATDEALPNAQAGPFREIEQTELGASRAAPLAMDDDDRFTRDASVLDLDGDPATLAAAGYFAATLVPQGEVADPAAPPNALVRHEAEDGRSFARQSAVVLEPEAAWEGGVVGAPSALRVAGAIWLYYEAAGGIGLGRGADGLSFTREPAPVLGPDSGGWEQGAVPARPGVVQFPDGSFRMFYEVALTGGGAAIGEARSADGVTWERVGEGPALSPSPPAPEGADPAYDDAAVGDPAPVLATSATGRRLLRVYYAARSLAGRAVIGLAARALDDGDAPLQRATAPVLGGSGDLAPSAPWVNVYPDFSLIFATQPADGEPPYPAVLAGVAPADRGLPPPAR